jgi:hypothetical protein
MTIHRRIAGSFCLLALASIALLAAPRTRRDSVAGSQTRAPAPIPSVLARGIETTIYGQRNVRAKVSADILEVSTPRLLGPFRLGVYRQLIARDVAVHVYAEEGEAAAPLSASVVADDLAPLLARYATKGITSLEMAPLRIFEGRGTRAKLLLHARACRTRPGRLVCWNGGLSSAEAETPFRRASFDGRSWKLETRKATR